MKKVQLFQVAAWLMVTNPHVEAGIWNQELSNEKVKLGPPLWNPFSTNQHGGM